MLVKTPLPAGHASALTLQVNGTITGLNLYHVPLNAAERIGKRSMAEGREGLVRLVSRIALQHPESLSRADNPFELATMLERDSELEALRQACLQLMEMVQDTQFANSCDIMTLCDAYTAALQLDRKRNTALDSAMNEVDEWNNRYRPEQPTPPQQP